VIGASYTTQSQITFNLEYHYYAPGFSDSDWRGWFAPGPFYLTPRDAELWYIREYAADQQVPLARNSLFLRADRQDAFIPNLELTGFVSADMRDGSLFSQLEADYYLSREWTIGALASTALGDRHSDFGSLPTLGTFMLQVSRYF